MSSHHPGHHLRPIRDLFGTFWTDFGSNLDPNQTRKMSNTVPGHKYGTGRRKYGTGRHKYGTARHTYQLNFQTSKFPACSMIWPGGMREAIKSAAPRLGVFRIPISPSLLSAFQPHLALSFLFFPSQDPPAFRRALIGIGFC